MTRQRSLSDSSRWLAPAAALLLATVAGCATSVGGPAQAGTLSDTTTRSTLGSDVGLANPPNVDPADPSRVHPTIETAALAALDRLRTDRRPATRDSFRVGRIVVVEGGYRWEPPVRATAGPRPVVRLASGPEHVATYLARGRVDAGTRGALEREHRRRERALVETEDRLHRPLFVLTQRGRVLAYRVDAERDDAAVLAAAID